MGQICENERQCFGYAQEAQQHCCPVTPSVDVEVTLPLCSWAALPQNGGVRRTIGGGTTVTNTSQNFSKRIWGDQ